jgi:23S rRNA (cytosine1962-C5)-methyltransferase
MQPAVAVSARAEQRIQAGHLWIYRSDVLEAHAEPGDTVTVTGARGRIVGRALYSDRSQIALRLISHGAEPVDEAFWRRRLEQAIGYRTRLAIDATAYRLIHAEGDLLPAPVVSRLDDIARFFAR